jgi:uncharacterized protein YjiS (DUF1127 family)
MGTIYWNGPFEGLAVWTFQGVLRAARLADKAVATTIAAVLTWQERARERHRMASLSDAMLRDIGISRADLDRECRKPFWLG